MRTVQGPLVQNEIIPVVLLSPTSPSDVQPGDPISGSVLADLQENAELQWRSARLL